MRRAHILKHNKEGFQPSRCIFVDTETTEKKLGENIVESELWFGWACYIKRCNLDKWSKEEWLRFEKNTDFLHWVVNKAHKGTKTYIFAHNMEFDFTVLKGFTYLLKRGWKIKSCVLEGPPTVISFKNGTRTIVFVCTLNYFRQSLESLGASFGLKKLPMPDKDAPSDVQDTYCKRDVQVIMLVMLKWFDFCRENDMGNFRYTLAGQAFSAFRHRFYHIPIYIDDNKKALELARSSYFGGRVECFYLGTEKEDLHLLDINSQYPFVMHTHMMPTRLISVYSNPTLIELLQIAAQYHVAVDVTIESNIPIYPVSYNGRLIFPVGKFRTFLTTPELNPALARNCVVKCHRVALYEKDYIFKEFVETLYSLRLQSIEEGNLPFAYMVKILMNSLYGKFGQNGRIFEEIGRTSDQSVRTWTEIDADDKSVRRYRQFNGLIQSLRLESESYDSHPAIAAHITAYARRLLWDYIETAGRENVYYIDTDSLIVNNSGKQRLQSVVHANKLGWLKHEDSGNGWVFRGVKDYNIGTVNKIKGIKKRAVMIDINTFIQQQFVGFKGMFRRGNLNQQIIITQKKVLTRQYKKGYKLPNGWVEPIRF